MTDADYYTNPIRISSEVAINITSKLVSTTSKDHRMAFGVGFLTLESTILITGIIANLISFVYSFVKLDICKHLAKFLHLDQGFAIIHCCTMTIGYLLIINGVQSYTSCSMAVIPLLLSFVSSSIFTASISRIRYYMAYWTFKNKAVRQNLIRYLSNFVVAVALLINAAILILNSVFDYTISPVVGECSGIKNSFEWPLMMLVAFILSGLLITIYNDVKLVLFMKQRKVQPIQMIAWVSRTEDLKRKKENGTSIPTNATILSSSSLGLCVMILAIVVNFLNELGNAGQAVLIVASLRTALHAPLILTLAVKRHIKEKKTKIDQVRIRPPTDLQFHE